ncbi:MAG: transposase [Symploca sp. SIO3C6]|uniref:Transposase n=1 Tax=Symploca sp. SIO1C4 TaxID=2607765 RepID=A0A6B3NK64_9CYAN|nr:transposase [Symploca sp. SIO3C6]NER29618.1 transposase [Symploca sp. SIO1C4]
MLLNYQYRVYPNTQQKLELTYWRRLAQYWYNWQLGERFKWWEQNRCAVNSCPLVCHLPELKDNPNYFSQKKLLPGKKKDLTLVYHSGELLDFTRLPSQTLQDVCARTKKACERFVKGDRNRKRSGRPRFKSSTQYRTLKIEGQVVAIKRIEKRWLWISISKLSGWLKIRLHRPLPDGFKLKNVLLTKKADGWYASLALEDPTVPVFNPNEIVPTWDNSMGMDAVLHEEDYLATSENIKLPSLKSFRKSQARLAKILKRKAAKKKGSKSRRFLAKRESREHQRIARARKDHAYNTAHKLISQGKSVFFYEDLKLKNLIKRNKAKQDENGKYLPNGQSAKSGLNKSWLDAAFGQFFDLLDYIASKAGAVTVKCNPAYTSQLLSYRDEFVFTDGSIREWYDNQENLLVDRDVNSAVNLKRVGLGMFPTIKRRRGNPVIVATITNSTSKEVLESLRSQKPTL